MVTMSTKKVETRGRKSLGKGATITAGVCLPEKLYNDLVKTGEQSGQGYGYHIREAIEKFLKPKKIRKKVKKNV